MLITRADAGKGSLCCGVLILAGLAAGCGGSDEDLLVREASLLPRYAYQLSHDTDAAGALTLRADWDGETRTFALRSPPAHALAGSYETLTGVRSLLPGSTLQVQTSLATPALVAFDVQVLEEIGIDATGTWTRGQWSVTTAEQRVSITVLDPPAAGVSVLPAGGQAVVFDWTQFEGLFAPGSAAPDWQQAASASHGFLRLALAQVGQSFVALRDARDAAFSAVALPRDCDGFGATPPAGILPRGERVMSWLGSADLGFAQHYTDCRADASGAQPDLLYRGGLTLSGWRAASDGANRLIFMGFGGDEFGSRVPGGVRYDNLLLDRVLAAPGGAWLLDPEWSMVAAGGFAVAFAQP